MEELVHIRAGGSERGRLLMDKSSTRSAGSYKGL